MWFGKNATKGKMNSVTTKIFSKRKAKNNNKQHGLNITTKGKKSIKALCMHEYKIYKHYKMIQMRNAHSRKIGSKMREKNERNKRTEKISSLTMKNESKTCKRKRSMEKQINHSKAEKVVKEMKFITFFCIQFAVKVNKCIKFLLTSLQMLFLWQQQQKLKLRKEK